MPLVEADAGGYAGVYAGATKDFKAVRVGCSGETRRGRRVPSLEPQAEQARRHMRLTAAVRR